MDGGALAPGNTWWCSVGRRRTLIRTKEASEVRQFEFPLLFPDEAARLRPGEQLVIVRAGDVVLPPSPPAIYVAPQAWVALTGPCPTCWGDSWANLDKVTCPSPDCHRGRRIEPLYTDCSCARPTRCDVCYGTGNVLVGRAAVQVWPVLDRYDDQALRPEQVAIVLDGYECPVLWLGNGDLRPCPLHPMPVAGRDFGVILDVVEVV